MDGPLSPYTDAGDLPKFFRADNRCICKVCGKEYSKHPISKKYYYLNELCDGTLVKL